MWSPSGRWNASCHPSGGVFGHWTARLPAGDHTAPPDVCAAQALPIPQVRTMRELTYAVIPSERPITSFLISLNLP